MLVLERVGYSATGTYFSKARPGLVPLDVADAAAVRACFAATQPAVVFIANNSAGGVDWCEDHSDEARAQHVGGTQHVLDAAAAHRTRVVFYSTDYVFNGAAGPYREDAEPSPISVYGRAKRDAEAMVLAYPHGALVVRTTAVVSWNRSSPNFAMTVWNVLSSGAPLRAPNDQWCNPTLAEFLAEASVRLVQEGANGIFNIAGKTRMTRADLAVALAKAMALDSALIQPVTTAALNQRAARPLQGGFDTAKLTDVLGTEPLDLPASLQRLRRQWRADTYVAAGPQRAGGAAETLKAEILDKVREYHALAHTRPPFVPGKSRVNYAGRVFGPEELSNLVDSSLDFWLTMGPYGELFETRMKRYFGARDFALVNSGSTANLTAVMALMSRQLDRPLVAGDEVITPAVTFPTTLAPLVHGGIIPVFVDCEVETCNIDPSLIEAAISPKTRALMIPTPSAIPATSRSSATSPSATGCSWSKTAATRSGPRSPDGSSARSAIWRRSASFRRTTSRWAKEAGSSSTPAASPRSSSPSGTGVATVGARRANRIPAASGSAGSSASLPCGYDHKYTYSNLGYNFKPTDMQAAIGVAQMDRLPAFIEARRSNFRKLYDGLQAYGDRLILPRLDPRADPSWFALPITVQGGVSRRELVHWLEHANIETREVFGGNILKQPGYIGIPMRQVGIARSDRPDHARHLLHRRLSGADRRNDRVCARHLRRVLRRSARRPLAVLRRASYRCGAASVPSR